MPGSIKPYKVYAKRRRTRVMRRSRIRRFGNMYKTVHHFKRTIQSYLTITDNATTDALYGLQFKLSDLPSYTEFVNLFDQYKLKKVVLRVCPCMNENAVGAIGTVSLKPYFYAIDLNDSAVPANINEITEYGNCHTVYNPNKLKYIKLYPKSLSVIYNNGVTVGYAENKSMWLDSASYDVKHYGVKMGFPTLGVAGLKYIITADYYIDARHSH